MAKQIGQQNGGNAVANRGEPKPKLDIRAVMEQSADRLAAVLPKHLTPERMTQVVSTLVYRTPKLQECHPHSILAAVMRACSLGLDLEPAMNEAFLIPRWNKEIQQTECQFQPGYQGLRKLACQDGRVKFIQARAVYSNDIFHYSFNPDLVFNHVPGKRGGGPRLPENRPTDFYAYAKLATGDQLIEVMNVDEVEAIRQRSQSGNSGPWVTDFGQMGCKTVIKRLCKSLPRSLELASAIEADDAEYTNEPGPRVTMSRPARGVKALVDRMNEGQEEREFSAEEGVSAPLRTEADDDGPDIVSGD